MAVSSSATLSAQRIFARHGGVLRAATALRCGIHPRTLYTMRDQGEIERLGRGLYQLTTRRPLAHPDWVAVALRLPRAVICLISALAHYELTTQVPHRIDIALPSHAQVPKLDNLPIRVFWYSDPVLKAGVQVIEVDRTPVRIFSPEKTIADCFKYRNKIGLDVAIEALRTYRERARRPHFQMILQHARLCRVEKIVRPYLEAIL